MRKPSLCPGTLKVRLTSPANENSTSVLNPPSLPSLATWFWNPTMTESRQATIESG
jgi:hypothetical protein